MKYIKYKTIKHKSFYVFLSFFRKYIKQIEEHHILIWKWFCDYFDSMEIRICGIYKSVFYDGLYNIQRFFIDTKNE